MVDRRRLSLPFLVAVLAATGCAEPDRIRTTREPRETEATGRTDRDSVHEAKLPPGHPPVAGGPAAQPAGDVRFLGAVVPAGPNTSYFVRLLAPATLVDDSVVKQFDALLNSIRVPGANGRPISWEAPPGAKEAPPRPVRVVTYTLAPGVEVYISEPLSGDLLANVNRWRTDFVGIPAVTADQLPTVTTEVMLGGTKAYRVDFRGPGGKNKGGRGPFQKGG